MSKPNEFTPWPANLPQQYHACWPQHRCPVRKDTAPAAAAGEDINYMPVFIPICPMLPYPGLPCQTPPPCPAGASGAAKAGGQAACPYCRPAVAPPAGNNAYILFLIFLLLVLGTRKEQILAAIRKILRPK